jgi:peptidoglycan hydrolase-like protein with peptidoglycan-binding domain
VTLARLGVSGAAAKPAVRTVAAKPAAAKPSAAGSGSYVPGARGAHVKQLQLALMKRGVRIPSGATGYFGSQTRAAVAAFQRSQGWSGSGADGMPGPVTLARLGVR